MSFLSIYIFQEATLKLYTSTEVFFFLQKIFTLCVLLKWQTAIWKCSTRSLHVIFRTATVTVISEIFGDLKKILAVWSSLNESQFCLDFYREINFWEFIFTPLLSKYGKQHILVIFFWKNRYLVRNTLMNFEIYH